MISKIKGLVLLTLITFLLGSCCKEDFEIPVIRFWAFVSNADSDDVTVIDASDQSVYATIDGSSLGAIINEPRNSAVSHNGKWLFVPCRHSNNVMIIAVDTPRLVAVVEDTSFYEPYMLAFTEDDKEAWVVNKEGGGSYTGHITIIDVATRKVTGRIYDYNMGSPEGIAIANGKAYVANRGDGTVSIYSVATHEFLSVINTGGEPRYALASPDGKRVYVSDAGGLAVINTSNDQLIQTVNANGRNLAISPDGNYVYVAPKSRFLLIVNTNDFSVTTLDIPGSGSIYGVAVSSSGDYGFASDQNLDVVYFFNPRTQTLLTDNNGDPLSIDVGSTPRAIVAN